ALLVSRVTGWPAWRRPARAAEAPAGFGLGTLVSRASGREQLAGRRLGGIHDLLVSGAPAEVPADRLADLQAVRRRVGREEGVEGDEHPGGADPALRRAQLDERVLERMR